MGSLNQLRDERTAKQIFTDEMYEFTNKEKKDIEEFLKYLQTQYKIQIRFG